MERTILVYDAFTDEMFKGNPAGVVLGTADLSVEEMQKIAREFNYPETVFIDTDAEVLKVRFFTPKEEVDLCGHATIAYVTALIERGILKLKEGKNILKVQTNLGQLPIVINSIGDNLEIMMYQASPKIEFVENLEYWRGRIAEALGITVGEFGKELEIVKAYTGIWDLMIEIRDREILNRINPNMEMIKEISKELEIISFHLFVLKDKEVYARNMAPVVDIPEEAATGTSNGALIYYLYLNKKIELEEKIEIVQGETMGRKSKILGQLILENGRVEVLIGGKAVKFIEGKIDI